MAKRTNVGAVCALSLFLISGLNNAFAGGVNALDSSGKTKVMAKISEWEFGDDLSNLTDDVMSDSFNPYVSDREGRTAYDYSVIYGVKPIEYALAKSMYKPNMYVKDIGLISTIPEQRVELIKIIMGGDIESLKAFATLNENFEYNYEVGQGVSPLAALSFVTDVDLSAEMYGFLVDQGADPNYKIKKLNGDTATHIFVASDNYLMLLLSISRGYNIETLNGEGLDVLAFAKKNNAEFSEAYLIKIITNYGKVL